MIKRFRRQFARLVFLIKVDMILDDYQFVWTSDWTRKVHRQVWTGNRFLLQLAINKAFKDRNKWGAALALVRIKMEER
jgi:hypothetical protein